MDLVENRQRSTAPRLGLAGVLGDIHAEEARLARALELFHAKRVGHVLFVGDVADGPGDLDACVRMLSDAGALGVRGNHERWLVADTMRSLPDAHRLLDLAPATAEFLRELPLTRMFDSALGTVLLCHGVDDDDMVRLRPQDDALEVHQNVPFERLRRRGDVALMLGGHTHERMVRDFGDLVVVNAGTLARDCADAGCVVVDCDRGMAELYRFVGEDLASEGTFPIESGRGFVVPSHG